MSLVACGLLACASASGPSFSPLQKLEPDESVVYVYRVEQYWGSALAWELRANGVPIGILGNGSYVSFRTREAEVMLSYRKETEHGVGVPVGPIIIGPSITKESDEPLFTLALEPGSVHYLRGEIRFGGQLELEDVSGEVGSREIGNTRSWNP